MKINVRKICGKKTITREDGEKINRIVTEKWRDEDVFYVDFGSVLVASVSFMDEAFGRLALEHSKEELQQKLRFENMLDYDRALINDIMFSRFRQKELGQNGESRKKLAAH